ncbi:MAG: phage tail length tape measure family protein [Acetobacteraceae bacterium]
MTAETATTALVFDASGAQRGAAEFKRAGESIIQSNDAVTSRIQAATERQSRFLASAERRYAPYAVEVSKATRELERLQKIAATSGTDAERASSLIEGAQKRLATAQAALSASNATVADTSNKASFAVRQFGIQSIDVFQQLASGAPVMNTFIQQGGQIGQVAATSGVSLGQLAKGVASTVASFAPFIAATAGVAALGAAIYTVFSRSSELEGQQRTLSVAIQGVGRSAELATGQLQGYVTQLRQQGVATDEAMSSVAALARNSSLSGGMIARIVGLGPDAAAALGTSVPDAITKLAEAAKGSSDAVQKLDEAFNLLTPDQAANVRVMIDHGDKARALETVFGALSDRISGLNRESLSPAQQAFRDLGNAWDDFVSRIARSEPVLRMMQGAANVFRDANVSDLTSRLTELQGKALELQRDVAGGGTSSFARRQQVELEAVRGQIAETQKRIDALLTPRTSAAPIGLSGLGPDAAAAKELDRLAASRVSSSSAGQIAAYTTEIQKFQSELDKLGPRTTENAARFDTLKAAIAANQKSLADLNKTTPVARTEAQKLTDTIGAQIATQQALQAAYLEGPEAVQKVTAAQKAQEKAISEGLAPSTEKYIKRVEELTAANVALAQATARTNVTRQIEDANQAADAQVRLVQAYDGTAESIVRIQNEQKAYSDALKAGLIPGTEEFATAVERLSSAYQRGSDAAVEFNNAQRSVSALTDTLGQAFDRLGQALVDAFTSGRGAAVNFGGIAKGILASVATDFAKLAVVNPILNAIVPSSGGARPTLSAALGALSGGGAGGSSILGLGSNLWTGVGITDALGLTGIKSWLGGITDSIGLTGSGGLFGGASSAINGVLGTTLWGGPVNAGTAWLDSMGIVAGAPGTGAVSLGSLLGGVGLGFGAGSLAGGFVQNAFGKVGPGPTIGAGLGSAAGAAIGSIIPGVGTVIGGLLGGLLVGGGGGLFGPAKATPYSATAVTNEGGLLGIGTTYSQGHDTTAEVQALQQQVAQINAVLQATGVRLANPVATGDRYGSNRLVSAQTGTILQIGSGDGGNGTFQTVGSLGDAFGALRFSSGNDVLNRAISGRSFSGVEELSSVATEITNFVNVVVPALKAMGEPVSGALSQQIDAITTQFGDAIAQAQKLGYAEAELTAARDKAVQAAYDSATVFLRNAEQDLTARYMTAVGAGGTVSQQRDAAVYTFDVAAERQRKDFSASLVALMGESYKQSEDYANRMAQLERALGQERVNLVEQFNKQINAEYENFNEVVLPALKKLGDSTAGVGSLSEQIDALMTQFEDAIIEAQKLGIAEDELTVARDKAVQAVHASEYRYITQHDQDLAVRYYTSVAANGTTAQQRDAALLGFDVSAGRQREEFTNNLLSIYGEAFKQTDAFAWRLTLLEETLGQERLNLAEQFNKQIAANDNAAREAELQASNRAADNALAVFSGIGNFARSMALGSASPLNAQQRYTLARNDFTSALARAQGGDFNAASQITQFASAFQDASRNLNGSGLQYATDFGTINEGLRSLASMPTADIISASLRAVQTESTTAVTSKLDELKDVMSSVLRELKQQALAA